MEKTYLTRKLKRVDSTTGKIGEVVELCIGEIICLMDPESEEPILEPMHMTTWYPIAASGEIIDGVIRIETVGRKTCISTITDSRNAEHPSFAWLRGVASELQSRSIRYEPLLRKNESQNRVIIDAIRL